jgi:hypothetical protein
MKFTFKQQCKCGGSYTFEAYGDADYEPASCSGCGESANLTDPLSVSRSAERLLYRSLYEMEDGDFSISILLSAVAVEHYLTGLYVKEKRISHFKEHSSFPTQLEEENWAKDKPIKVGSFSDRCDSVCKIVVGKVFTDCLAHQNGQSLFANSLGLNVTDYIQQGLFDRRNRIAHRGYVNSDQSGAKESHDIARNVVSVLREVDKERYGSLWIESDQSNSKASIP